MRHRKPGNRLSRPADQRKATIQALAAQLLKHDEIITTLAKAKAVKPKVEKIITTGIEALPQAKSPRAVHLRRQVNAFIQDRSIVNKVFTEIAPRYKDRHGGYTRILKAGFRRGDAAAMAIIQLV